MLAGVEKPAVFVPFQKYRKLPSWLALRL